MGDITLVNVNEMHSKLVEIFMSTQGISYTSQMIQTVYLSQPYCDSFVYTLQLNTHMGESYDFPFTLFPPGDFFLHPTNHRQDLVRAVKDALTLMIKMILREQDKEDEAPLV